MNKVALITAAGSGMGAAIARKLAGLEYKVAILSSSGRGEALANIQPGFIDSLPEKQVFRDRIPMGRYGTTDEIAETVAYLVSNGATYITGQNIRVDGVITRSI